LRNIGMSLAPSHAHSSRKTPDKILVHIGRTVGDSASWWSRLASYGTLVRFPCWQSALQSNLPTPPRATIIVSHYEPPSDLVQLETWRRRYPLSRLFQLNGPWGLPSTRTSPRLPTCTSFAWHETSRLFQAIDAAIDGISLPTDLPGHDVATSIAHAAQPGRRTAALLGMPLCRMILVSDPHNEEESEAICTLLQAHGHEAKLCTGNQLPAPPRPGELALYRMDNLRNAMTHPLWPAIPQRVALVPFPTPALRTELLRYGFRHMVALPLRLDTLLSLDRSRVDQGATAQRKSPPQNCGGLWVSSYINIPCNVKGSIGSE
jgi:hypothetical protein